MMEVKKNKNRLKPPAQSYEVEDYIKSKQLYLNQGYMNSLEGETEEGAARDEGIVISGATMSGLAPVGESGAASQGRGERENVTSK